MESFRYFSFPYSTACAAEMAVCRVIMSCRDTGRFRRFVFALFFHLRRCWTRFLWLPKWLRHFELSVGSAQALHPFSGSDWKQLLQICPHNRPTVSSKSLTHSPGFNPVTLKTEAESSSETSVSTCNSVRC